MKRAEENIKTLRIHTSGRKKKLLHPLNQTWRKEYNQLARKSSWKLKYNSQNEKFSEEWSDKAKKIYYKVNPKMSNENRRKDKKEPRRCNNHHYYRKRENKGCMVRKEEIIQNFPELKDVSFSWKGIDPRKSTTVRTEGVCAGEVGQGGGGDTQTKINHSKIP